MPTSLRSSRSALAVVLLVFGVAASFSAAFAETVSAPTTVRTALAQSSNVQGAPNRTMVLSRVIVEPGAELALHHHLGTQISRIASGTLTYTVRQGSAVVREGDAEKDPHLVRAIAAGQTARIKPGQWLVEQPSDIHEAANRGADPVVIYLATLLKSGAPPATPVSP